MFHFSHKMSSGKKMRRPPPLPLTLPPNEDQWGPGGAPLQPGGVMGPPPVPPPQSNIGKIIMNKRIITKTFTWLK